MASNLNNLSDRTPFEESILDELEENEGLAADSPVHAYKRRSDDPVQAFVRGVVEEAEADQQYARLQREHELLLQFQQEEPDIPIEELERSAASIAQMEEPDDYFDVINPEYDATVHGATRNPTTWGSAVDAILRNRTVKALRTTGRAVVGGLANTAKATIGAVGDLVEATTLSDEQKESVGIEVPEPQGEGPNVIQQAAAGIPTVTPENAAEGLAMGLVQFASFFIPAKSALTAVGMSGKLSTVAASTLEAFANRLPDDKTLTTWLAKVAPGLEGTEVFGPAIEFMKSDPEDSEALRRFKFVIEDLVLGGVVELGANPKATAQSLTNMFDAVRQSRTGGAAMDILTDQSGALWFGRPKRSQTPLFQPLNTGAEATGGAPSRTGPSTGARATGEPPPSPAGAPSQPPPPVRPPPPAQPQLPTREAADLQLARLSREFNDEVEKFRRGDVRHIKDVANEARAMGVRSEDFVEIEPGNTFNDTQTAALGMLQIREATTMIAAAERYLGNPTPANAQALHGYVKDWTVTSPRQMGALREWGRTGRIAQETEIARNDIVRGIDKAIGESQAGKSTDIFARMLTQLGTPEQAAKMLNGITEKMRGSKTLNTLLEVYANSLLSKPVTFVRNSLGSTAFLEAQVVERQVAGLLDIPIDLFTGRTGQGVALGEAREMIHGQWVAKGKALKAMVDGISERPHSYRMGGSSEAIAKAERKTFINAENYGLDPSGAMGKFVNFAGRQVRWPSRLMQSQDQFNRVLAREGQLHAIAFRKAREVSRAARQGGDSRAIAARKAQSAYESVISDPRPYRDEIEKFGNMATFTDQAGPLTQAVQQLVDAVPVLRFPLMFINTPSRIISQAIQRVPIMGLAQRESRQIIASGTRAERELLAARQAVGMGIASMVFYLAANGRITAEGSRNPTLRTAEYNSKIPPRALGVGDDGNGNPAAWVPYNNLLEPYTTTLGAMADLSVGIPHAISEYQRGNTEPMQLAGDLAQVLGETIINSTSSKSYLKGINDIIDAMSDSKGNKMATVMGNLAAGFVPNVVRGIDAELNPEIKDTNGAWERFKRAVPYFNGDLRLKRDQITGEPLVRDRVFKVEDAGDPVTAGLALLFDISNPVIPEVRGENPLAEAVYEQILRDKLTGIGLEASETYAAVNTRTGRPEDRRFTDEQYERLVELRTSLRLTDDGKLGAGDTLLERLAKTMTSEAYQASTQGTEGGREFLVRQVFNRYDKAAMAVYIDEDPEFAAQLAMSDMLRKAFRAPGVLSPEGEAAVNEAAEGIREEAQRRILIPK